MKKLLTTLCLVLLVSCSDEVPKDKLEVLSSKLEDRQGITYEINSTIPFTGSEVSYYKNGQLAKRLNLKNGDYHGSLERFYENGQLSSRYNYKDGKPDGLYENFYENGQLKSRENWKTKNDFWDWYYEDGEPHLDGLFEYFYENGQLEHTENYNYGYKNGVWKTFDGDGNPTLIQEWKDGELIKIWKQKGKIQKRKIDEEIELLLQEIDEKEDDPWENLDEEGNLTKTEEWKDGKLVSNYPREVTSDKLVERQGIKYEINSQTPFTGIEFSMYPLQLIYIHRTEYKNGKKDGLEKRFHKNGQLEGRVNNKDGKKEGILEIYYENGQLKHKVHFKDGKTDGLREYFYENGQLEGRVNYKNEKKEGFGEMFHQNGQLHIRQNYKNDERDGLMEVYYENGQLREIGFFKNGKQNGLWEDFDEEGNLTRTQEYKDGELIE